MADRTNGFGIPRKAILACAAAVAAGIGTSAANCESPDGTVAAGEHEVERSVQYLYGVGETAANFTNIEGWGEMDKRLGGLLASQSLPREIRRSVAGYATSVLTRLALVGDSPEDVSVPDVGGVGITLSRHNREAYFEFRASPIRGDKFQAVLFLTDYGAPENNQVRRVGEDLDSDAQMVAAARDFLA